MGGNWRKGESPLAMSPTQADGMSMATGTFQGTLFSQQWGEPGSQSPFEIWVWTWASGVMGVGGPKLWKDSQFLFPAVSKISGRAAKSDGGSQRSSGDWCQPPSEILSHSGWQSNARAQR